MSNRPTFLSKHKVCVICEGLEEFLYFNRLLELNLWSTVYHFTPINAKGESNVFARFQDAYNNDNYEIVIIFCDTDKRPSEEYLKLKAKVNNFFDMRDAAQKLILWANPCSMQIILSHFGNVALSTQAKKTNAPIIEALTGVKDYDGHEKQVKSICNQIHRSSYGEMKERLRKEQYNDEETGSSNVVYFVELFERDDIDWIKDINRYLDRYE